MRTERLITDGNLFTLIDGSTFETLAGQFQRLTNKIICIKDGTDFHLFNGGNEIPPYLKYESEFTQDSTGIHEYYFRSLDDNSLYAFFLPEVSRWLRQGRQGELVVGLESGQSSHGGKSHLGSSVVVSLRADSQRTTRTVPDLQRPLTLSQKVEMPPPNSLIPYRVVTVPPGGVVAGIHSESSGSGTPSGEIDDVSGSQFSVEVPDEYRVQDCVTCYRRVGQQ